MKAAILGHAEFTAFNQTATKLFDGWRKAATKQLTAFDKDGHPKALIETIAESLLDTFKTAPLLDAYDIYQHLMDYWAETMQDDAYLIAADGWVAEYFVAERDAIDALDNELAAVEQQMEELREENSGEDGLLAEVIEGEGDKEKITAKAVKARLKEIGKDSLYDDERMILMAYSDVLAKQTDLVAKRKAAQRHLDEKIDAKYPTLTDTEIKILVVHDKWMTRLEADAQKELGRVSQTLTGRIRELAERYATPMPQLSDDVLMLAARVEKHLAQMGASWT